jgi:hypothetical protein
MMAVLRQVQHRAVPLELVSPLWRLSSESESDARLLALLQRRRPTSAAGAAAEGDMLLRTQVERTADLLSLSGVLVRVAAVTPAATARLEADLAELLQRYNANAAALRAGGRGRGSGGGAAAGGAAAGGAAAAAAAAVVAERR